MLNGEEKLVNDAIRGEASAFGSLYDYYQPKIYRFVIIKVGTREEAEDLTHQVFLSAWQNIHTYQSLGYPFGSWLYQIARNQVIDHYRARKANVSLEMVNPEYFIAPVMANLGLDRKLELERAVAAIQNLKQDYQDVVILRFVEEYSIKETAELLSKTEGAVKQIQNRALKELKEKLYHD